jgi:hypothetical protein
MLVTELTRAIRRNDSWWTARLEYRALCGQTREYRVRLTNLVEFLNMQDWINALRPGSSVFSGPIVPSSSPEPSYEDRSVDSVGNERLGKEETSTENLGIRTITGFQTYV